MTEERIARNVLMSAALVLGVAGCKPEPPDDNDAGIGGSATGGTAAGGSGTGGSATGGTASVCVGATVASLPTVNTQCTSDGESQCDATGNRCVCQRGRWYCTTLCDSAYPTEPTPYSACMAGAVCNYPSGASCACPFSHWWCTGTTDCPANMPQTGAACNGLAGRECDYQNSNPALHMLCACVPNPDPSTGSTWTCMQSATCPTTQPAYGAVCSAAYTICSYGSTRCICNTPSTPWVCGLGLPGGPWMIEIDLNTNIENCGATGRMCSTLNVMGMSCQGGVCTSTCSTGWLNVSQPASGPDDGCETVDLATNTENCGATGRSCSSQNVAARSCQSGVCTSTCQTGWLNVSQPASGPDDGCETIDTATNVDHCGEVGRACSSAHVLTRLCTSGLCTPTCQSGYGNVNRPVAPAADDGCDKPVTTCTFGRLAANETLSSYTEAGFTVVATTGSWQAYAYGAPGPAIAIQTAGGAPVTGQITVTAGGSPFHFVSVDLYSSVTPIPYVFTGLMGATTVFSVSGTVPNTFGTYATAENPRSGDLIDTLIIELTNSSPISNPMALDNLRFAR